ncbi:hypothetical protein GCM10017786_13920 [Amycolatopsis deserti]|uniref:Uncharacterized protein n=2 Tax=Amycolatopsis deserti TaxID=185696 RepID=A0ABQ3IGQ0_9PSEU|nr:hypothetical protein GCM10017786_13920 [Amycolatopsis deserti]
MLVTGVVVVVGYASGLGLSTSAPAANSAGPAQTQSPAPHPQTPVTGDLPQAQVPDLTLPGTDLTAPPADPVADVPGSDSVVPVLPVVPGTPAPAPGTPVVPPATPGAPVPVCLPGLAQNVVDTANTVVTGLPLVGDLTGTAGLTQSPDGTDPGLLNTLLYGVTGYCAPPPGEPAPTTLGVTSDVLQGAVAPRVTSLLGG